MCLSKNLGGKRTLGLLTFFQCYWVNEVTLTALGDSVEATSKTGIIMMVYIHEHDKRNARHNTWVNNCGS